MNRTTHYVPILKDRRGELTALKHMADELAEICLPLIDFVPGNSSRTESDGQRAMSPRQTLAENATPDSSTSVERWPASPSSPRD
ncbi:beta family protein [Nocardia sp.]|uniref:beta family protein n=1 Tax=Nocardia sp. TaxID=1821 RepID=UPI003455E651